MMMKKRSGDCSCEDADFVPWESWVMLCVVENNAEGVKEFGRNFFRVTLALDGMADRHSVCVCVHTLVMVESSRASEGVSYTVREKVVNGATEVWFFWNRFNVLSVNRAMIAEGQSPDYRILRSEDFKSLRSTREMNKVFDEGGSITSVLISTLIVPWYEDEKWRSLQQWRE